MVHRAAIAMLLLLGIASAAAASRQLTAASPAPKAAAKSQPAPKGAPPKDAAPKGPPPKDAAPKTPSVVLNKAAANATKGVVPAIHKAGLINAGPDGAHFAPDGTDLRKKNATGKSGNATEPGDNSGPDDGIVGDEDPELAGLGIVSDVADLDNVDLTPDEVKGWPGWAPCCKAAPPASAPIGRRRRLSWMQRLLRH